MQASAVIESVDQLHAVAPARPLVLTPPVAVPHPGAQTPPSATPTGLWDLVSPYAWTHRWALALCLFLNALPGFAMALQTVAPAFLLDHILNAKDVTMTGRYLRLGLLLVGYLFVAIVLRMYAWYGSYKIFTRVRESIILELRARFFRHINGLCLRFHGKHSSGELFTYVMGSPLAEVSSFYHTLAMNVPNALCLFLTSILMLGAWDMGMTAILVVSVILTVISSNSGQNRLRALMEDFQDTESKVIGRVADIFRGNRDVKMYAIEEKMSDTFYQTADVLRQKVYNRDLKTHHVNMRQEAVGIVCFILVCLVAAGRYMNGHLTGGQFWTFMAAFGALQTPVQLIFQLSVAKGRAQASANRLGEMLTADSTTPEPRRPAPLPKQGALVARDLTFGYTKDEPVLKDINITIPYGQSVAFVGPSGSGKSTLAKLLLRLYDPDEGSMSIDDINIRDARTTEIRQRFGVVPQDPYFFSTSIRENLLVVKPNATQARIQEVCEIANIWGFIEQLPEGLDTVIGEGGARLSGGQRQRLAIARSLLHEPGYFVFDEATSALDTVSERMVQEAFSRILPGKTAIFIAHRLSTIKDCDRIIVLDEGRIIQDGTFEQLRNQPGLFQRMVESDHF